MIFNALVEGKAELMIPNAEERRMQAKLHLGVLYRVHPNVPFDRSEVTSLVPRDPIFAAYVKGGQISGFDREHSCKTISTAWSKRSTLKEAATASSSGSQRGLKRLGT
jgi:hypothetical protein